MPKFNHFDFIAPVYDRFIKINNVDRLTNIISLPENGILLDVGGGTGRISKAVKKTMDRVFVADQSFEMLHQINPDQDLNPVCMLSEELAFPDEFFDRVIIVDALHHVYDAQKTCEELWRVTKQGGRIVIEEPNINTIPVKLLGLVEKLLLMRSHFHKPDQISTFLKDRDGKSTIVNFGYTAWVIIDK